MPANVLYPDEPRAEWYACITRIESAATALYHQIMHEYHRYPASWTDHIRGFYSFLLNPVVQFGITLFVFPLVYSAALLAAVNLLALVWLMSGLTRFVLQGLYADEAERTELNQQAFTRFSTRGFALIGEMLYRELTQPLAADANDLDRGLSISWRLCQAIMAPVFIMAAVGEWLSFNVGSSLRFIMQTMLVLGAALLINTPLYAMDLYHSMATGLASVFSTPGPETAPSARASFRQAPNSPAFFAGNAAVARAANAAAAEGASGALLSRQGLYV